MGDVEDIMTHSYIEIYWRCTSHLPDLVSTMMALAQHLNEVSTAPMATDSVGSRVR